MKLLYLIIAHKNPSQMARMLSRLSGEGVSFLIHVDGQVPVRPFVDSVEAAGVKGVHWSRRRYQSPWGTFGMTRAIIANLRDILAGSEMPDYIVCISGMDYPLRPSDGIKAFFAAASGRPVIRCAPLKDMEEWGEDRFYRLNTYFYWHPLAHELRTFPADEPPRTLKGKLLDLALRCWFPLPKRIPSDLVVHGGSSWWGITPDCARFIVEQDAVRPEWRNLFRHCSVPEELYIHTILGNSAYWREQLDPRLTHYQYWSTTKHPDTLTMQNREALLAAAETVPLARKFDIAAHPDIIDWIDANLLVSEHYLSARQSSA